MFAVGVFASVAVTVKDDVPSAVGVPDITPEVLSDKPVGNAPEVIT